jgi:WD40 repeat protein
VGGLIADDGTAPGLDEACPFPGLAAFTQDDAARFTGRERETEGAVNRLRSQPLLAVVGPSGAGKSSFVQAGLLPALPPDWLTVVARPGPTPLISLAARLEAAGLPVGDLRAELEEHAGSLGALLRAHLAARRATAVLVIDQLEELFTLCDDLAERALYAEAILRAARSADDPVRVVVTMRDDFLVRAAGLPGFSTRLAPAIQILTTPARAELHRILTEPLERAGYELDDPALADEMVQAVADRPGALALLSFTASKLWELRDQRFRQVSRRAYESIGGIGGALARHADATFAAMHAEEQRLVRELFRHAVTAEGTRAVLSRSELEQILGAGGAAVIEKLVAARLLVASETEGDRERIEIAHEALIEAWPRLLEWRRQDADGARMRDQLRVAARQWEERGRPGGLLWRGEALDEYRLWRARSEGGLTDSEEAFAAASLSDAARARRLRRALLAITIVGLLAVVVALLFLNAQAKRSKERSEASAAELSRLVRKQYESQGRQLVLAGDPVHGLAYLAKARELGASGAAHDFLIAEAVRATEGEIYQVRQESAVTRARFSRDGRYLVTCGFDGTARVWDARDGHPIARLRHRGPVRRIDLQGDRVMTASSDGTAGIWQLSTGVQLQTLAHGGRVQAALLSPDGRTAVTVGADDSVVLWDAQSGRRTRELLPGAGDIARLFGTPVAFSPDGSVLAVGSDQGRLRMWRVASGRILADVQAHSARINAVQFSPDGQTVLTASADGRAAIWRLDGGQLVVLAHRGAIYDASFSPDGGRALTASADRTAVVWDAHLGTALVTLAGHAASVGNAMFSPDGRVIVTVSDDATAQLWDAQSGRRLARRLGHQAPVNAVDFDPAGDRIATAAMDGVTIVWTTEPEERLRPLGSVGQAVASAEFSPRDDRVVTASIDGHVAVWDGRTGARLALVEAHQGAANIARFSPDATAIASGGDDGVMRIWYAETGAPLAEMKGHAGTILHLAWAPDGRTLLSVGGDGTVRTWTASGRALRVLDAGSGVSSAEFTPAGDRIVTVSDDTRIWDAASGRVIEKRRDSNRLYTIDIADDRVLSCSLQAVPQVWKLATGSPVAELAGHAGEVVSCRFAPGGTLAATGGTDGTARIWDPTTGDLLGVVRGTSADLRTVAFSHDGAKLVISDDTGAVVWSLPRFTGDFDRVIRCRVPVEVVGDRLVPRARDPAQCGRE